MKQSSNPTFNIAPEVLEKALEGSFSDMLDTTFTDRGTTAGTVVKGLVTKVENDMVTVDIGMKAEGRVSLSEFVEVGQETPEITVGDEVDVYVDSLDDLRGEARLSREKACREEVLDKLEKAQRDVEPVKGVIFGKVKGGFTVDLSGVLAFLPGSQVDVRPIKDITPLMHTPLDFMVVKLDRARSNLIVSRRAVMDESRSEARDELLQGMHEGKVLDGVVKNITDYGAFVDLGGIDGLLHITDMAWHRITHPSELMSVGQVIKVQVIRFDEKTKRVSLGMKQLHNDPWTTVDEQFPLAKKVTGIITNITDYGAFVELAPGVEGLIHVSEMSWTRKNVHPGKLLSTSQEVEVQVLEIDRDKRRISLGLKQCQANPWQNFAENHPEGAEVEGVVRSVTDFGVFVGLTEEIDGLVHMSDISWDKSSEEALQDYKKGDTVNAKILSLDPEKERVSLGIKQLSSDPMADFSGKYRKGAKVKAVITAVEDNVLQVMIDDTMPGIIKKNDLDVDKANCDTHRFNEGDKIEAKVMSMSKKDRTAVLSVRALQHAEEKEAVATYASDDSGATLGDALSEALSKVSVTKPKPTAKKAAAPKAEKADASSEKGEKGKKLDAKADADAGVKKPKAATKKAAAEEEGKEAAPKKAAAKAKTPQASADKKDEKDTK